MKAKNKYASPESQVFELKMSKRVLNNGSPLNDDDHYETSSYGDANTI